MNKAIKTKLDKIIDYAKDEFSGVEELTVFGEALTDDSESAIIRLAALFDEELDVDFCFYNLLAEVECITDGHFELHIMNGGDLPPDVLREIERGEIIYYLP